MYMRSVDVYARYYGRTAIAATLKAPRSRAPSEPPHGGSYCAADRQTVHPTSSSRARRYAASLSCERFNGCSYPRLPDVSTKRLTHLPQIILQGPPIQAATAPRSGYLTAVGLSTRLCARLLRKLLSCEEGQEKKDKKDDECGNEQKFRDSRTSGGDSGEPENCRDD